MQQWWNDNYEEETEVTRKQFFPPDFRTTAQIPASRESNPLPSGQSYGDWAMHPILQTLYIMTNWA
jgi:hypothetical protein